MKVAIIQFDIAWENKEANFKKVNDLATEIRNKNIDLIILPELFATGYTMNSMTLAEMPTGKTAKFLSSLATKYKVNVLGSYIKKTSEKPQNAAVIFNKSGKQIQSYSKIHLPSFTNENKYFKRGHKIATFEINNKKFGIAICYDLRFPELFRKLTEKDVECTAVIASWPIERIDHWDQLLKARAIENQMHIIGVNRVGKSPMGKYPGHSVFIDPMGKIIKSTKANKEEVMICDVDFDLVAKSRKKLPIIQDRIFK